MHSRYKRLLIGTAFLAIGSYCGVLYLANTLSAAAPSRVGDPPENLSAVQVEFESASDSRIRGWWVPGQSGKPAIVLAHSLRANRCEMISRARFLCAEGYSVLLYDAQAHGESTGKQITFGFLEAHDARAAVAFARERAPRVAFLGFSLGGAAALLGETPLEVDALILEAVYPTLKEATHNRIAMRLGPLAEILAPLLLLQVEPRIGVSASLIAPIEGISRVNAPLFLIAGELDQHTTLAQSKRMFEAALKPKRIWVVPNTAHANFHNAYPAVYERRVLEFLASAGL